MAIDRSAMTSKEREKASVFHSWSAQATINPFMVKDAAGVFVTGEDDLSYLDLSSQLVNTNIGHQHPAVVQAIQEQAGTLCTIAPQHGYVARYRAAELILDRSFDGAAKVFFTNGGTEAMEHAIRMARLHTGRHKVMSAYRSYHGATATSINLTGDPRRWPNDTGSAGVVHFFGPFFYRSMFHSTSESEECERALANLEATIRFEGPDSIAAIVLETVPGTAGIMVPPKGYLQGVRALCDRFGIVYVADEVMCGFGRTGAWFAFHQHEVRPDLVVFAKGVNSGYVPLGGVIVSEAISATFNDRVYPGGLTYSGHPLACAAGLAALEVYREEELFARARRLEPLLAEAVHALRGEPHVIDIRNFGLAAAIELAPRADGVSLRGMEVFDRCFEQGVMLRYTGDILALGPAATASEDELGIMVDTLRRALRATA